MRVLVASPIYPEALEKLCKRYDVVCAFQPSPDKLKRLIHDREVVVFRSGVRISADVMVRAPELKLLIRAGCGVDNVDLDYVIKRGLKLERIAEPGARAVAEMSIALMLALARNLLPADRLLRKGYWAKEELMGDTLRGKTLGIVGAGNIGSQVGQLGAALGMKVIGCVENPTPEIVRQLDEKGIGHANFSEVVSMADFLSIHVPLTESTRHLINEAVLARMKMGSYLINLSRGGVVDERALHKALTEGGRLRGAALDVHEDEGQGKISPLAALPNVILTPHIGAQTFDSQREIGERVIQIIESFEANVN